MTEKYIRAERKCSMDAAVALPGIEMSIDKVAKYTQQIVREIQNKISHRKLNDLAFYGRQDAFSNKSSNRQGKMRKGERTHDKKKALAAQRLGGIL